MYSEILPESLPKVIGIAGPARSGKDTLAHRLCVSGGYFPMRFAGPIKQALAVMFGWDGDYLEGIRKEAVDPFFGFSPRVAMQTLGTEWGRNLDKDLWVKVMEKQVQTSMHPRIVIPDVRFENEASFIRDRGVLVHVYRGDREKVNFHISESRLHVHIGDFIFHNEKGLGEVRQYATHLLDHLSRRS